MVKRLRHHPFTVVSRVRIPVGSPNKPLRLMEESCHSTKLPQGVARGQNRNSRIHCNFWKYSSVGRASALQAGGHRFEPCYFHQNSIIN